MENPLWCLETNIRFQKELAACSFPWLNADDSIAVTRTRWMLARVTSIFLLLGNGECTRARKNLARGRTASENNGIVAEIVPANHASVSTARYMAGF